MREPVSVESLRFRLDFDLEDLTNGNPTEGEMLIGQPRASEALQTGLGIKSAGFNIFVAGVQGTGKISALKDFLKKLAEKESTPPDWCYVNNFSDPYRPKKIRLPRGRSKEFKQDMHQLVTEIQTALGKAFESEEFATRKDKILGTMKSKKESLSEELQEEARKADMVIKPSVMGIFTFPMKDGRPLSEEEFAQLGEEEQSEMRAKQSQLNEKLEVFLQRNREIEREANQAVMDLEKRSALFTIESPIAELKHKYSGSPEIVAYLEAVKQDILDNIPHFLQPAPEAAGGAPIPVFPKPIDNDSPFTKYEVNVLVDNTGHSGAPIVIEQNPTYNNLLGKIEKESRMGALVTNFTLIREGSLHRANGGYLIVRAKDLLSNPFAWEGLKRCLQNKEIEIEDIAEKVSFFSAKTLKPETIPLNVKVILVDEPFIYQLLYQHDKDFRELFKVKADFDTSMPLDAENVQKFARLLNRIAKEESLPLPDASAMEKLVAYGARLEENREKLSTRFGKISDVLREASYYAERDKAPALQGAHIRKAIESQHYRSNLVQEKLNEWIRKGVIAVALKGKQVGQVNGLSVTDMGDISFGFPGKITASTSIGGEGVLDIEREVRMGGPIHSKGVLILTGYLNESFGRFNPVSMSARLVFEQSYSGVEGDSASSAELYCLLSSLSGLPIDQSIAVTGSVNQKGEVQAVGGINEKVEGFFEVCRLSGLTGEQGVILPYANLAHLLIKDEVIEAIESGQFRIWAVKTIDEGIEILTGVPAGAEAGEGEFEEGSVKHRVNERLREMSKKLVDFTFGTDGPQRRRAPRPWPFTARPMFGFIGRKKRL